jgi:hypothetical protein
MPDRIRLFLPEVHRWADDERCECGHARTEHDDVWTSFHDQAVRVEGRGRCCEDGCACRRFKFDSWISKERPNRAVC